MFSIGYAVSAGAEESFDSFLRRLDSEMYNDKRERARLRGAELR